MSVLVEKIIIEGDKGRAEIESLFDSGASYSCINKKIAEDVATIVKLPSVKKFATAEEGKVIEAHERITIDFKINGLTLSDEFFVLENLSEPVIIGASTLQKWRIKLDFENEKIVVDEKVTKLRLMFLKEK